MKFLEVTSLFGGEPAELALLSTFQFEPDFFERKVLRCKELAKARRIAVLMDAREWTKLVRRDPPARWLNRRYLVVPVERSGGVFHPKLTLTLSDAGGQVQVGSNNLTRSGCSSNLELLNAVAWSSESPVSDHQDLGRIAFAFFRHAALDAETGLSRILREWLDDAADRFPWIVAPPRDATSPRMSLVHSYGGDLWSQLRPRLERDRPYQFLVMSPFHDREGTVCRRLAKGWPGARIEVVVQSNVTQLSVRPVRGLKKVVLKELAGVSRRAHAKLIAWRGRLGCGCMVGSANCTSAAFDGGNVEACLLLDEAEGLVDALFDSKLFTRDLAWDDFEPGAWDDGEPDEPLEHSLQLRSAIMKGTDRLVLSYVNGLEPPASVVRLSIQVPGEPRPRVSAELSKKAEGTESVVLPADALADVHAGLLALLVADTPAGRVQSMPAWVVQEERLTYEPAGDSGASARRIQETGEGLPAYLDELGARDGVAAVIEYLRHLNIQFEDGDGGRIGHRPFRVKVRDPFRGDIAPGWLISTKEQFGDLGAAILDFVDRHIEKRLRRHSKRGNINGMGNFVDIFSALVGVLLLYHQRGVIKEMRVLGRLCDLIEVAAAGREAGDASFTGYLRSVYDHLAGDVVALREACAESNCGAHVRAVLLIAQGIRFDPREPAFNGERPTRPREVLPTLARGVKRALSGCEPTVEEVQQIIRMYGVFSAEQIDQLLAELPTE